MVVEWDRLVVGVWVRNLKKGSGGYKVWRWYCVGVGLV